MSELKTYFLGKNNGIEFAVYLKSEVDEAVEELKAKLESVQASAYAESVDVGMENRKLKHALWIARAERAFGEAELNNQKARRYEDHKGYTMAKYFDSDAHKWNNVGYKCLKKSEEYK